MSPEPYVRGQAFVFSALLVAAAILGPPDAALACGALGAVVARALYSKYRRDVAAANAEIPHHRERLDLIVAGDSRAAVAVGMTAAGLLLAFDADRPDAGLSSATPPLLAFAAAAVYLSSLVDWYVILPRVSGLLGPRPCRAGSGDCPRFPKTWRETTRWWSIHRIAAALVLSFGLSYAITITVDDYVELPGGASVVAGAALGGLAAYRKAAFRAFMQQAGHPTMIVGRTVQRRRTQRRTLFSLKLGRRVLRIPGFKRRAVGRRGPREYVFDVALESVELVPAAPREKAVPRDEDGNVLYERYPTKVPLRDVDAAEPAEPFTGCEGRCSGINWYCIENPSCFETK